MNVQSHTMREALTDATASTHRPLSGWIWFALMIGGWSAFFALVIFAESALSDLWEGLRNLPLLAEGLVWLLFFPLVLATAVWESSWQTWLRVLLVACFALGWSLAFFPRRKKVTELDR
jgi:hypothetical protein